MVSVALWMTACQHDTELLSSDFPLNIEETAIVEQLLENIESHDPESDSFRYPYGRKMQRTHPKLVRVNLKTLKDTVGKVTDRLGKIGALVDYRYSERSEYERNERDR